MSAEKLETTMPDRIELPQPAWVPVRPRLSISLGLRQIMLLLVYCSGVALAGRYVYDTDSPLHVAALGVLVGAGLAYFGIWLAVRLGGLAFFGWVIFVIGYIVATASVIGLLVIPSVPILIGVIIYLHIQRRRNQQNGLLWVLAVASERAIPLAPGVEAYSQQNRGIYRERAHTLAFLLQRGQSLSQAVDWVPRVVPWDAPLLIRVGELTGRLPQALREAAETRSKRRHALRDVLGRLGYLLAVISTGQGIVGFVAYFIIPKFQAIFQDFGIGLPESTLVLMRGANLVSNYAPVIGLAQLAILGYLAFALGGRGIQGLPILGRLFRLRHKSLVLRTLAMTVEADQPFDRAFELMTKNYPARRIRRKIKVATEAIRTGASWTDALLHVRLISASDVGVLDAATRAGNLAWALRTLAETGERRFAYRLQIWSHLLFLVSMVGLGLLVLFIAVALFTPLVQLIERLS